jgi:imidazole glycerol-phosphate synthase subunit HisH
VNVSIVNTGIGNFGSLLSAIKRIGAIAYVASEASQIQAASHIIIPGVGNFDIAMRTIDEGGLRPVLAQKVLEFGTPVLGICLGMQLLGQSSEEGALKGLGWFKGRTVRFSNTKLRVPHIGWNRIKWRTASQLSEGIEPAARFYFVHSYHYDEVESGDVIASTDYEYALAAVLRRGNIVGTQFHPEKSRAGGLRLLRNFLEMGPQ